MDLPTCPACGQSVLDDDPVECPFCGAPMDGSGPATRPVGTPKPNAPAAKLPKESTPAAAKTKADPKPKQKPAKDDPFGVEREEVKAIPLAPKPIKSRQFEVVCPMCETTGYAPRQASEKPVRCANKECLVPIFDAPPLGVVEEEPEEEPSRGGPSVLSYILIGIALAVGAGFLFWANRTPPQKVIKRFDPNDAADYIKDNDLGSGENDPQTPATTDDPDSQTDPVVEQKDPTEEWERQALTAMNQALNDLRQQQVLAAGAAQLADAALFANDEQKIQSSFELLDAIGTRYGFYSVSPRVTQAWLQKGSGRNVEAVKTTGQAFEFRDQLRSGRLSKQAVAQLAALLLASGRQNDAVQLLKNHGGTGATEQLVRETEIGRLLGVGILGVDAEDNYLDSPVPLWDAAIVGSVVGGNADEAREAIDSLSTVDEKIAALSAWGTALAADENVSSPADRITAGIGQLPAEGQAAVLSRVGRELASRGNTGLAKKMLAKAKTALESLDEAEPMTLAGSIKEILEQRPGNVADARRKAIAFAEASRTAMLLQDNDTSTSLMQQAVSRAGTMAPPISAIQEKLDETESSRAVMISRVKRELELRLDDEDTARRRFNDYREALRTLKGAAAVRNSLVQAFHNRSAEWPNASAIWSDVGVPRDSEFQVFSTKLRKAAAEGNTQAMRDAIGTANDFDADATLAAIIRATLRLAEGGKNTKAAIEFAADLPRTEWTDQTLRVAARTLTRSGHAEAVWETGKSLRLRSTAQLAFHHGFIAGLHPIPELPPKPEPTEGEGTPDPESTE